MLWASTAHAEPLPIDLSWNAPEECPSRDEVMGELERITRVKEGRVVVPISAQATIERTADGRYRLHLRTQREDQTGNTDLVATSCPVLKRGVTLVLVLALGDGVEVVDEAPAPVEKKPEPPPPPPPNPKPAPPPPMRPPTESLRVSPWLAATLASGLSGKPAFAPQLGVELGQRHWSALAEVAYFPARAGDSRQGIEARYSALSGALAGCARWPIGGWAVSGCAAFSLGFVRGESNGAFQDGAATAPWVAAGPRLVLHAPLVARLKLRAALGLDIGFEPPAFAIRDLGEVYTVSRLVPSASLGLAL